MKLSKLGPVLTAEEAGKRLMPQLSTLHEAAGPAVQWCLRTKVEERWGTVRDGVEVWAVLRLQDALSRLAGRVALAFVEWADSIQSGTVDTADGWNAASTRRASWAAVIEEANRIHPGWKELEPLREKLEANGELDDAWEENKSGVSRAVRWLALACAAEWKRLRKRQAQLPFPVAHPLAVAGIASLRCDGDGEERGSFHRAGSALAISGSMRGGSQDFAGLICPTETELVGIDGGRALLLAAVLCRIVHAKWILPGEDGRHYDWVKIPLATLTATGILPADARGKQRDEEASELFRALASVKVSGLGALVDSDSIRIASETFGAAGGRPTRYIVARVGIALCPYGVADWCERENITLPDGLRFWGAAFNPAYAPLVGYKKTRPVQCAAYAVGLGQWLMSRREEYAELGGVKLDTLPGVLKGIGLYVRSHASLAADVMDAWRRSPNQLALDGPKQAVLIETSPGSGRWKLSEEWPEYRGAHLGILAAAEVRKDRAAREAKRGRNRKK